MMEYDDDVSAYLDVGCALDATTGVCTDDTATLKFTLANSNTYKIKVNTWIKCLAMKAAQ